MLTFVFRDALRLAARGARVRGAIDQVGLQTILDASEDPETVVMIECAVYDQAVSQGLLSTGDGTTKAQAGVNWAGLLAFIQALIPIIQQLIVIFGGGVNFGTSTAADKLKKLMADFKFGASAAAAAAIMFCVLLCGGGQSYAQAPAAPEVAPVAPVVEAHHRGHVRPANLDLLKKASHARHGAHLKALQNIALPASYETPYMIPNNDQGQCGSCWDRSSTNAASCAFVSAGQAKGDGSFVLSADTVMWCYNTGGCGGDDASTVFNILKSDGLPIEKDAGPYQPTGRGPCNKTAVRYKISDWGFADTDNNDSATYAEIKAAIFEYGACVITVDAGGFNSYSGGVMTYRGRGTDHQIMVTGWDDGKATGGALHVKNQWGTWGETYNGDSGYAWLGVFSDGTIAASGSSEVLWCKVGSGPVPPTPPGPPGPPVPPVPGPVSLTITVPNNLLAGTYSLIQTPTGDLLTAETQANLSAIQVSLGTILSKCTTLSAAPAAAQTVSLRRSDTTECCGARDNATTDDDRGGPATAPSVAVSP